MLTLEVSYLSAKGVLCSYPGDPGQQEGALAMDKDTTPAEPRLDEDLTVEDESAEQVTGGHIRGSGAQSSHIRPAHINHAHTTR